MLTPYSQRTLRRSSRSCDSAADGADVRDRAALERHGAVGQRQRQVEVMVDDQDRDLVAQLVESLEQLFDDRRREALEGLVEQQHAGVARERTRHRHHLLLAARQVVGRRAPALLDAREEGEDLLLVPVDAGVVAPLQAPELHVLGHRHAGEQAAALRHVGDAAARDLGRRAAAPAPRRRARCCRSAGGATPMIDLSSVDLPAPLRPSSATISCSCTSKLTSRRMWLLP